MRQQLTPPQRKAYDQFRAGIRELLVEYEGISQQTLAQSVGATQSLVSQVLRGRVTSIQALERLARALMIRISQSDRRALQALLDESLRALRPTRKPEP